MSQEKIIPILDVPLLVAILLTPGSLEEGASPGPGVDPVS